MNGLPPSAVDDQSCAAAVFERRRHVGILTSTARLPSTP